MIGVVVVEEVVTIWVVVGYVVAAEVVVTA